MRQTGGRPRVQMLFTAPDITDDEGLQPVSLEEIKDIASSFDLSQGDSFEETTANIPYATPVESNNRLLSHPEVPQPVYDSRPKARHEEPSVVMATGGILIVPERCKPLSHVAESLICCDIIKVCYTERPQEKGKHNAEVMSVACRPDHGVLLFSWQSKLVIR